MENSSFISIIGLKNHAIHSSEVLIQINILSVPFVICVKSITRNEYLYYVSLYMYIPLIIKIH